MRTKWFRWMAAAGLSPMLFGTVSHGETIHHGIAREPGNSIPDGSQDICQGVPSEVALIPHLTSGFAISDPSSSSIELVFSDVVLACRKFDSYNVLETTQETCSSGWAYALTIPPELQKPGVYILSEHGGIGFEQAMAMGDSDRGCGGRCSGPGSGSGTTGSGPTHTGPPGVTLEIYSVTDQCITGRLQGLSSGQISPPPPDFNGGFHAVRCVAR